MLLLATILLSVVMVMLESVRSVRQEWGPQLIAVEWGITLLFTVEYAAQVRQSAVALCVEFLWDR